MSSLDYLSGTREIDPDKNGRTRGNRSLLKKLIDKAEGKIQSPKHKRMKVK